MTNAFKIPDKKALEILEECFPKDKEATLTNPMVGEDGKMYVSIEVAQQMATAIKSLIDSGYRSTVYGIELKSALIRAYENKFPNPL